MATKKKAAKKAAPKKLLKKLLQRKKLLRKRNNFLFLTEISKVLQVAGLFFIPLFVLSFVTNYLQFPLNIYSGLR